MAAESISEERKRPDLSVKAARCLKLSSTFSKEWNVLGTVVLVDLGVQVQIGFNNGSFNPSKRSFWPDKCWRSRVANYQP